MRREILELLEIGITSVLPMKILPQYVSLKDDKLIINDFEFNLNPDINIYVIGAGKATGGMAEALEQILGPHIKDGLVNIPDGTSKNYKTRIIKLNEASHPIPSRNGVLGSRQIVQILKNTQKSDLVIVILSGGGSALLPLPIEEISLKQLQDLNNSLIKSGATIQEINTVRKHCSQIKGGQLAKFAYPAKVVTLILSDVIGNSLDSIASGPTVPDSTTFKQAITILKKYHLWGSVAPSIRLHLEKGLYGDVPETPKPNDLIFQKTYPLIIGDIGLACEAVKQAALQKGFNVYIHSTRITGEAKEVGTKILQISKDHSSLNLERPFVVLGGGEPTVTVKGHGIGGRCQEMGLGIISKFHDLTNSVFAAIGTDGIDGYTNAAGVIIDYHSTSLLKEKHLDPNTYLKNNDSYNFFRRLNDSLIFTGPTGTNVNDLIIIGRF
ncbi:MAG: glycerate kinase type-2 family protein [Candidatus Helarchaeota archaeon]